MSKNKTRRVFEYVFFWIASILFLASYFAFGNTIERIDVIYTVLFHLSIWFAVGINSFLLIPRFLAKGKWWIYFPALSVLILLSIRLNQFTFDTLSDWLFPGYFFISYYEWDDLLTFFVAYLGGTSLIQFSRSWFREVEAERKIAEIRKESGEQEMRLLKAQIQPHFLFNSLNTVYGLIRKSPKQAADAVVKLSDLLRYTIRQSGEDFVELKDEIAYIHDYVEFQKMRSDYADKIHFQSDGNVEGVRVAPLLFITFVENAFKYGERDFEIRISVVGQTINFTCKNNVLIDANDAQRTENKNGTGIENVRKRLALIYPGRHELEIKQNDDRFEVNLEIT